MSLLTNPVLVSVVVLCVLCLLKLNVLMSLIIAAMTGAVLGGIGIGSVESFTTSYISSSMADTFVFLILIIVLVLKPAGIMGKNVGEKV